MKSFLASLCLLGVALNAQNVQHPDYWKNRKPAADYWQQDVHYTIDAVINDETDMISGKEKLQYRNNSPDVLDKVYFHLYQNAFQPGSYNHHIHEVNHDLSSFGKYEAQKLGTVVDAMKVNGVDQSFTLDNTILIVHLKKPIQPGEVITFDISFRTWWDNGSMRRRFKKFMSTDSTKHYDGVHWYPRICVYDRKFGWETDQHLEKEFYGDFGVYDVRLTFPSNYIVEATGVNTNEDETMPADLKYKIHIDRYSDSSVKVSYGKNGEAYSRIEYKPNNYKYTVPRNGTKTWIYHAENVHDFAFTADPSYRKAEVIWNGIRCIALAQEPNAAYWRPTAAFVAKVVEIYSTDIGMYGYPKMVAADARDGMEYPMITLNGGNWPGHQYVIAHEVGHNWFFGMVGNNETYRAMLDEGFTQFLTSWSLKKIRKDPMYPSSLDDQYVYNGYLYDAMNKSDAFLNTHSDDFSSATGHGGGYRHVYYKTATMLYNLQYVLGDELFLKAMKHYFDKWKFAHPYPEDFRQAIIEYTHVDLNWFFDEWMETTKAIDYKIISVKKLKGGYKYEVKFKRKGAMQMPLDFRVTDKNGKQYDYYVPNTYFQKSGSAKVLKTWKGWGLLNSYYMDTIVLDGPYRRIEIDPSHRLADINRLDNRMKRQKYDLPVLTQFNNGEGFYQGFNHQNFLWRPDVWFNAVDGVKAGLNLHSEYARHKHVFDFTIWYNTGLGAEKKYSSDVRMPLSMRLQYRNLVGKDAYIFWDMRALDGVFYDNVGFEKAFGKNKFTFRYKTITLMENAGVYWPYLFSKEREGKANNSLIIDYSRNYRYKRGNGVINASLRGNGLTKDYAYGAFHLEVINHNRLAKFDIHTRFFTQHIEGSNIPEEVMLNLSGANMEAMLESKFTRSRAFIPQEWLGYGSSINHFHMGGGLNLRGYSGYLSPVSLNGQQYMLYRGNGGISGSVELDFDGYIPLRPKFTRNWLKIDLYAFADGGWIYNSNLLNDQNVISSFKADAGLGIAANIYRWGKRSLIQPFTLRLDAPVLLNVIPNSDKGYFAQRWVIGIGRSF